GNHPVHRSPGDHDAAHALDVLEVVLDPTRHPHHHRAHRHPLLRLHLGVVLMDASEKSVLIIGGGVAALSAAAALVEQNDMARPGVPKFKITVATSDAIWGGRASSWRGGDVRFRFERQF